jgi:hypothetical protein
MRGTEDMSGSDYNDLMVEAEILWLNYYDECIWMEETPLGFNSFIRYYYPYILEELERLEQS